jgi:hypothetical protein
MLLPHQKKWFCDHFYVAWSQWDAVMSSLFPRQYPVICPTVWIDDDLPTDGFSYEEVGSFGGGSWDYGGV